MYIVLTEHGGCEAQLQVSHEDAVPGGAHEQSAATLGHHAHAAVVTLDLKYTDSLIHLVMETNTTNYIDMLLSYYRSLRNRNSEFKIIDIVM